MKISNEIFHICARISPPGASPNPPFTSIFACKPSKLGGQVSCVKVGLTSFFFLCFAIANPERTDFTVTYANIGWYEWDTVFVAELKKFTVTYEQQPDDKRSRFQLSTSHHSAVLSCIIKLYYILCIELKSCTARFPILQGDHPIHLLHLPLIGSDDPRCSIPNAQKTAKNITWRNSLQHINGCLQSSVVPKSLVCNLILTEGQTWTRVI